MNEKLIWCLDQEINNRGVAVDGDLVERMRAVGEIAKVRLNNDLVFVTNGAVKSANNSIELADWIRFRGVDTPGVSKSDVLDLLDLPNLPDDVRDALNIRQQAARSSLAKLDKIQSCMCNDGRIRGMFQYHGASTGRWAGRLVQLQNLPRPTLTQEEIDGAVRGLLTYRAPRAYEYIRMLYGRPMDVLASLLRSVFIAKRGNVLIGGDYSAIEARMLAWMAGERWVLDVFTGDGLMYERNAADIYNVDIGEVTKDQRFVGKFAELALGYCGGIGAFKSLASAYRVDIDDETAEEAKTTWRSRRPRITQFWYDLDDAAQRAVREPGQVCAIPQCNIRFVVSGSFLWCQLPSGRTLCYPYPRLEQRSVPWGGTRETVTYMGIDQYTRKWTRIKTYGGKLCENVVQAACRDLLAHAMLRARDALKARIVMHVHDEIVLEANPGRLFERDLLWAMQEPPAWASTLPVDVETWTSQRYRK